MPKGDRWLPSEPLKDGAAALQNKINGHDPIIKDHDDRINDLETGKGQAGAETVIVVQNGIAVYAQANMTVTGVVT
jgi:hypothetical protein